MRVTRNRIFLYFFSGGHHYNALLCNFTFKTIANFMCMLCFASVAHRLIPTLHMTGLMHTQHIYYVIYCIFYTYILFLFFILIIIIDIMKLLPSSLIMF